MDHIKALPRVRRKDTDDKKPSLRALTCYIQHPHLVNVKHTPMLFYLCVIYGQ
jgi:hypothetical protein